MMRIACDRVADCSCGYIEKAWHMDFAIAALHVGLDVDAPEHRLVHFLDGRGKHLEYRGARLGVLSLQDLEDGFALFR